MTLEMSALPSPTRPRTAARPIVATAAATAAVSISVLVAVSTLADAATEIDPPPIWGPVWWLLLTVLIGQCVGLLLWPRIGDAAVLVVCAALPLIAAILAPTEVFSISACAVLAASFTAGLRIQASRVWRSAVPAAMLVGVGQWVNAVGSGRPDIVVAALESAAQAVVVVAVPLLPALAVAGHRAARAANQRAAAAQAGERDAQIGAAIARERAAMARELHDIAAHHLSGISIMASVIERQVESDTAGARSGARQIRHHSKAVLDDLRRLVGMLRSLDDDGVVRSVATIAALVEATHRTDGAHASGTATDGPRGGAALQLHRSPRWDLGAGISALAQHAAYRAVQEALTNSARHARGAVCVVVVDDRHRANLTVTVRNEPADNNRVNITAASTAPGGGGTGLGIIGMRERAALVGADLEVGATDVGGWEVRMSIPRDDSSTDSGLPSDAMLDR